MKIYYLNGFPHIVHGEDLQCDKVGNGVYVLKLPTVKNPHTSNFFKKKSEYIHDEFTKVCLK